MRNRLLDLREENNYTQSDIENATGINQSEYSKMERGARTPTYEQCRDLAIFYKTSMDYIAGLTDIKDPYPRTKK